MLNHIYALIEIESKTKFYIGFTKRDPNKRLSEHKSAALNYTDGDELKYQYASALDAAGIEWTLEVLHKVDVVDTYNHDDVEDYYINLYRNEPLQNMRAGMQSAWMGTNYNNIDEFLAAKQRHLNKTRAPKVKKQSLCEPDKMIFSFENPNKKFVSPAFEALAKRKR